MIEVEDGNLEDYDRIRRHVIEGLFEQLGGEVPAGGPIAEVVRAELYPKDGDPDDRRYDNYVVDAFNRALAVIVELKEGRTLSIVTVVYAEPRTDYLGQADPLAASLPHSQLN